MTQVSDIWVTATPQFMAIGESRAFTIDFADYGTPGSVTSVTAYNAAGTDVSSTLLSGSSSLSSTILTCKLFTPATAGLYRIVAIVAISGNAVAGAIDVRVSAVQTPPTVTNGYITLQEFKDFAKIGSPDPVEDTDLASLIMAASRIIDDLTGRTFYARTETHYYNTPDTNVLFIEDDDLLTITTLTNGDATVITSGYYKLYPLNASPKYMIVLKPSTGLTWSEDSSGDIEGAITIAGTWGFSATAPEDIKQACKEIVMAAYKRRFGETYDATTTVTSAGVLEVPQEIPGSARQVIQKYRRLV